MSPGFGFEQVTSCRAKMLSWFASKQYSCSGKCAEKGAADFYSFLTENVDFDCQNESLIQKGFKSERLNT